MTISRRTLLAVPALALPFLATYARKMRDMMHGDTFPFGVEANRPTWEQLLLYTYQQGIAHRHAKVEEIFPPGVDTQVIV